MMKNKRLIAKIMDGDTIVMTIDQNLMSAEFGALDRGSLTTITDWGIYVNIGSLSFVDNSGFFNNETVNNAGVLGYTVKFYLAHGDDEILIGTFKAKSASFNEETKEVTIECVSKLEQLQRKNAKILYPNLYKTHSASEILALVQSNYNEDNAADPFIIAPSEHTVELTKSNIYCAYFGEESLWARINKICEATMCRVYDDEEGNAVISSSFASKSPIVVKPQNIINIVSNDYVSPQNFSISAINRKKMLNHEFFLPNVREYFTMNFNDKGEFVSVSNADTFSIRTDSDYGSAYTIVKFSKNIKTSYNIYGGAYVIPTITSQQYQKEQDNSLLPFGAPYTWEGDQAYVDVGGYSEIQLDESWSTGGFVVLDDAISTQERISSVLTEFKADYFTDSDPIILKYTQNEDLDAFEITSNDLIQTESYYESSTVKLANHILTEVSRRYRQGIECFEIECLFNDYYYEDGSEAFDSTNLSRHFKKYDIVIPYVMKRGQSVPMRKNPDGTPKKFRIIGISYLYDGLLRQKLQVQEERYDID